MQLKLETQPENTEHENHNKTVNTKSRTNAKHAGYKTFGMFWSCIPWRSCTKGEQESKACSVALRKHKFAAFINPLGVKSFMGGIDSVGTI